MLYQKTGFCIPSKEFPKYSTIILHEGDPKDFCTQRGMCSILGLGIKTPTTITITSIERNPCTVTANEITKLTLEFLDQHLNSFKPTKPHFVSAIFNIVLLPLQK